MFSQEMFSCVCTQHHDKISYAFTTNPSLLSTTLSPTIFNHNTTSLSQPFHMALSGNLSYSHISHSYRKINCQYGALSCSEVSPIFHLKGLFYS